MRRLLLLFALFVCANAAYAARHYQIPSGTGGFVHYASPTVAISEGCVHVLYANNLSPTTPKVAGSSDWTAISNSANLPTVSIGTTVEFICQSYTGATLNGTATLLVIVIQTCPIAGSSATAIMQTTIATYTAGSPPQSTSADAMPNPQCSAQCVIEHPTGVANGALCEAYVASGVTPAVGSTLWVVCSTNVGFVYTGASCNYATADYTTMTGTSTTLPMDAVPVIPEAFAGTAVDTSDTCVDADANGYDDDSGVACSVLAAAQLDALTTLKKTQMENVGTGATMPGDVNALAALNGGIFSWPQALLNFLNPPSTCDFQFVLNALPMLSAMNVTAGWCSFKVALEPFLAFGMWVITIFVSGGFFQRVS